MTVTEQFTHAVVPVSQKVVTVVSYILVSFHSCQLRSADSEGQTVRSLLTKTRQNQWLRWADLAVGCDSEALGR